jgi:hypothetical protein
MFQNSFTALRSCHLVGHSNIVSERSNSDSKFFSSWNCKIEETCQMCSKELLSLPFSSLASLWHFRAPTRQHWIDFDSIAVWTSSVELFLLTANWCLARLQSPVLARPLAHIAHASKRVALSFLCLAWRCHIMACTLYTLNLGTFLLAGKHHNHVVHYHTCV